MKVPGAMVILVAPVVVQLSVLLEPKAILAGFAENELITGAVADVTVTVRVDVVEPAALEAVNV